MAKKTVPEKEIRMYEVLTPLRDGVEQYAPGEIIEMDASEAEELVDSGALRAGKAIPRLPIAAD